ncbi:alpha/beta fold hydrolase [Nonomuraea thailandensis]
MARMIPNPGLTMSFMSTARFDLTARLASVGCPALVVAGSRDPITPLGAATEIVHGLPGARLEVFERSGHFIPDTEGERFFALLRSFITGVTAQATLAAGADQVSQAAGETVAPPRLNQ